MVLTISLILIAGTLCFIPTAVIYSIALRAVLFTVPALIAPAIAVSFASASAAVVIFSLFSGGDSHAIASIFAIICLLCAVIIYAVYFAVVRINASPIAAAYCAPLISFGAAVILVVISLLRGGR